jgi:hypothetical protein
MPVSGSARNRSPSTTTKSAAGVHARRGEFPDAGPRPAARGMPSPDSKSARRSQRNRAPGTYPFVRGHRVYSCRLIGQNDSSENTSQRTRALVRPTSTPGVCPLAMPRNLRREVLMTWFHRQKSTAPGPRSGVLLIAAVSTLSAVVAFASTPATAASDGDGPRSPAAERALTDAAERLDKHGQADKQKFGGLEILIS